MKPLMLIPPAQAEALFDAFTSVVPIHAAPDDTWLDEDTPDDFVVYTVDKDRTTDRLTAALSRTRQAA